MTASSHFDSFDEEWTLNEGLPFVPGRKMPRLIPSVGKERVKRILLTPELAEYLLDCNVQNRKAKAKNLERLCHAQTEGQYTISWDMIAVSSDGKLLNGQHRCMAVLKTGIPMEVYLMLDAPEIIQQTGDRGSARSLADTLHMRGEPGDTLALQAAIFFSMHYMDGTPNSKTAYTTLDALAWFEDHQDLREFLPSAGTWYRAGIPGLSVAKIAALAYLFSVYSDANLVAPFFTSLSTGADLKAGSPVLVLRRGLINASKNSKKTDPMVLSAWVIKCWNNYVSGDRGPTLYRWSWAEPYPTIVPA